MSKRSEEWAKKKGFKSFHEYQDEWAKSKGFKDYVDYQNDLARKLGFENFKEYNKDRAIKRGFKDRKDYLDKLAQDKGFESFAEEARLHRYKKGIGKPMNENKECSQFLGVHIAERVLSKVFDGVERMFSNNPGYDFICNKGYKIDVKSSCLAIDKKHLTPHWRFAIRKNSIPDYFLLLAFDNREALNPMHIWLINKKDTIGKNKKEICKLSGIEISTSMKGIYKMKKFELTDKLEKVKECCDSLKE